MLLKLSKSVISAHNQHTFAQHYRHLITTVNHQYHMQHPHHQAHTYSCCCFYHTAKTGFLSNGIIKNRRMGYPSRMMVINGLNAKIGYSFVDEAKGKEKVYQSKANKLNRQKEEDNVKYASFRRKQQKMSFFTNQNREKQNRTNRGQERRQRNLNFQYEKLENRQKQLIVNQKQQNCYLNNSPDEQILLLIDQLINAILHHKRLSDWGHARNLEQFQEIIDNFGKVLAADMDKQKSEQNVSLPKQVVSVQNNQQKSSDQSGPKKQKQSRKIGYQKQRIKQLNKIKIMFDNIEILLKSEQLKKYLKEKSNSKQLTQAELQYKKFEFIYQITTKIKNGFLNIYDQQKYAVAIKFFDQILERSTDLKARIGELALKVSTKVNKFYEQQRLKAESEKLKQEQEKATQLKDQTDIKEDQQKPTEQTKDTKTYIKSHPQISIEQLSILLVNWHFLPASSPSADYQSMMQLLLLQNLTYIPISMITCFMLDCITYDVKLSIQFLSRFYDGVSIQPFNNITRFVYLCFIDKYMDGKSIIKPSDGPNAKQQTVIEGQQPGYQPLYPNNIVIKRENISQHMSSITSMNNYVKLLVKEFEVGGKGLARTWLNVYNKKIIGLDSLFGDRKLSIMTAVKWYNMLSNVFPIGTYLARQISLYKDYKVEEYNLDEMKQFVKNVLKNLEVEHIHSIQQYAYNEITYELLSFVNSLSKQIVQMDPEFLIQISTLLSYQLDFKNQQLSSFEDILRMLFDKFGMQSKDCIDIIFQNKKYGTSEADLAARQVDSQKRQKILKLINFISKNQVYIEFKLLRSKFINFYESVMVAQEFNERNHSAWRFLYQVTKIMKNYQSFYVKTHNVCPIRKIYQKFCEPYIKKHQQNLSKDVIIRQPRLYEEYILRIGSFIPEYFHQNIDRTQQLISFVNNNFIYTAKSVLKTGIFDILIFFDALSATQSSSNSSSLTQVSNINPQIYAYLYCNLSSFIIYMQVNKKFYLKRGKNFKYQNQYINLLRIATKNCNTLKHINNKDRLNTLKMLAVVYWQKLSNRQIAQLLVIIGNPFFLNNRMKQKLAQVKFTTNDIDGLDLNVLAKFKFTNSSLINCIYKLAPNSVDNKVIAMKLSNDLTKQELQVLFQNQQFYQEALQNNEFVNEHLIPQPVNESLQIKRMYACLKIISKIRKHRNYSLSAYKSETSEQKQGFKQRQNDGSQRLNLDKQMKYVHDNDLVKLSDVNVFKLDNVQITGHYEMVEGWSSYQGNESLIQMLDYNLFGDADTNMFEKILLAVNGNYGLLKQLVKKQPFIPDVLIVINKIGLEFTSKGSLLEVNDQNSIAKRFKKKRQNEQSSQPQQIKQIEELYLLCSKPKYAKLHMIYCYIFQEMGLKALQVTEDDYYKYLANVLIEHFKLNKSAQNDGNQETENKPIENMNETIYHNPKNEQQFLGVERTEI